MKQTTTYLIITLVIFSLQSCLNSTPNSDEFKRTMAELEKEKENNLGEVVEDEEHKLYKATDDKLTNRLCDLLMSLPSNKNRKDTYAIIDSITPLLSEKIDPNCACAQSTYHSRFGASIPIIKNMMRNKTRRGKDNITSPMHIAANKGSDSVAMLLLKKGFDFKALDSYDKSVLEYGVFSLKINTVEELIKRGAKTEGICLCGITNLKKIKQLTAIGLDSSGVDVSGGLGTFMTDKNLNAYLKYNPDINNCPPDLFFASKRNDKVIRKFIKYGLAPYTEYGSSSNKYVISELTQSDVKDETLVLLLENIKKENIELINEPFGSYYILHKAIKAGHPKMVAKLLELGADPDIIDRRGKNAIDLAENKPEILKLLNER